MKTPVLLIAFNRPEHTQKTFEQIRRYAPKQLFIAVDGPRNGVYGDQNKIKDVQRRTIQSIDWDCEVKTLVRDQNLGAGINSYKAIDWFFEHVEEGIIFDDDCVADPSFFTFCEQMLDTYRDSKEVMHIAGCNFLKKKIKNEYFFSKYNPVWGWATWKRAWKNYDFTIDFQEHELVEMSSFYQLNKKEKVYWNTTFNSVSHQKRKSTWDYQWTYHIWKNQGICITPGKNLITNIGFDETATHSTDIYFSTANLPTKELVLKDTTKKNIAILHRYDRIIFHNHYLGKGNWIRQIKNWLYKQFPHAYGLLKEMLG